MRISLNASKNAFLFSLTFLSEVVIKKDAPFLIPSALFLVKFPLSLYAQDQDHTTNDDSLDRFLTSVYIIAHPQVGE